MLSSAKLSSQVCDRLPHTNNSLWRAAHTKPRGFTAHVSLTLALLCSTLCSIVAVARNVVTGENWMKLSGFYIYPLACEHLVLRWQNHRFLEHLRRESAVSQPGSAAQQRLWNACAVTVTRICMLLEEYGHMWRYVRGLRYFIGRKHDMQQRFCIGMKGKSKTLHCKPG